MDWRNRLDQIRNKLKLQLHAKGVDNLLQMKRIFDVIIKISHFNRNTMLIVQALLINLNSRRCALNLVFS